jgi:hypothetical protein
VLAHQPTPTLPLDKSIALGKVRCGICARNNRRPSCGLPDQKSAPSATSPAIRPAASIRNVRSTKPTWRPANASKPPKRPSHLPLKQLRPSSPGKNAAPNATSKSTSAWPDAPAASTSQADRHLAPGDHLAPAEYTGGKRLTIQTSPVRASSRTNLRQHSPLLHCWANRNTAAFGPSRRLFARFADDLLAVLVQLHELKWPGQVAITVDDDVR